LDQFVFLGHADLTFEVFFGLLSSGLASPGQDISFLPVSAR
jgi:hypothetical protein